MSKPSLDRIWTMAAIGATLLLATACGGGGSSDVGVGSGGTGLVSGTVTKGPLASATVTAYGIAGGQLGAALGTAITAADGAFNLAIGSYSGPLMLQVSGGSYTDEATGAAMAMAAGDVMTVALPTVAAGMTTSGVQVTPVTAMAQARAQHMAGGMTDANIAAANTAMGNYFSVADIVHVQPMNPLVSGSGAGASLDAQNYGMTLAAMSRHAQSLGLGNSSAMVTALMNDAADGMMDGRADSMPVQMGGMMGGMTMPATAGTSGLGVAMTAFMNSAQNKSGVTNTVLVSKLMAASGQIMAAGPGMNSASVAGTVFNGAMSRATVTAYAVNGGMMGAQIASTATDGQGGFTMSLGAYSGALMLQATGGVYRDEATAKLMTMGAGDFMSAAIPMVTSGANVTGVWVTPMTSMAQARSTGMSGGMTDANITAANAAVGNYFSIGDVLHTRPIDPTVPGAATGASQDARNCGLALAALSQYATSLGMPVSSAMVMAMMADAVDGLMDGKRGASPISMPMGGMMGGAMMSATAATSGMAAAITGFMNSAANASGMSASDMAAMIHKLAGSDGHL